MWSSATQLSSGYWRRPDSEIDDTELAYEEPLYNIAIFESATALHVRRGPATHSRFATRANTNLLNPRSL